MAMIPVGFAELHNELFLGGKNFNKKLDPKRYASLHLEYDTKEKELLVTWVEAKKTAHVPHSNVAYYIPGEVEDRKLVQLAHPMVAGAALTAQVETPMGHVHAGLGHGKTGQTKTK